ncbi:hypothetical protein V9T40_003982 [Parthenolecanium corni]|uniref:G-protein coupled receptors family 1 profile domain-containing protein n=1 Tax=Parthenolecanium corni TaxID=536013 RepID=A0AAN9TG80_9HEMI
MSYNSSYFFGDDTISGWGPRYFFSFYSEYGEGRSGMIIEVSFFVVIFVLSFIANLMIAAAVLKYPEMRTVTNCFLLNLTAADIAFVAGIPALVYTRLNHEWELGNFACKLLPYSQFVCGFVLLWTLTWISMDRYRCIVVPPFRSQLTPKRACLLTTITWLIASVIFLPVALWFREQTTDNNLRICTLVFPKNDTVNVSLLFLVPTLLLSCIAPLTMFVYYYQQIFRKLNETKDRWRNNDKNKFGSNKPDVLRQQEEIRLNRHMRVIRILLLNVLVVLIMWLPITVIMFLIYVDGSRPNHDTNFFLRSHHFIWTLLIALLNTVVNPLLYGVMSENFRKCFLRMRFLSRQRKALTRQIFCDGGPGSSSSKTPTMVKTQFQFTNAISIID